MGRVPQIVSHEQVPLRIDIPGCWFDHCFNDQAVLPAVEAMQHLAASVLFHVPQAQVMSMQQARFHKFFLLDRTNPHVLEATHELQVYDDGSVASALLSKSQAGKAAYTRTKKHVSLCFTPFGPRETTLPDPLSGEAADWFRIDSQTVYSELVPFRDAYHNLRGEVLLHPDQAQARMYAPPDRTQDVPLGSPFPLDAAFHAACAWAQRYTGIVAFPVGCDSRTIFRPTREKEMYAARIRPQGQTDSDLTFDIWILGRNGEVHEAVSGVRMRDVSGGRMQPPAWIRTDDRNRER